uniref:Uncharacterized protein n=1 Tax=Sphaerodactylus townsendi TaxID=933632 RepID=A0ACB8EIY5_9SAUR
MHIKFSDSLPRPTPHGMTTSTTMTFRSLQSWVMSLAWTVPSFLLAFRASHRRLLPTPRQFTCPSSMSCSSPVCIRNIVLMLAAIFSSHLVYMDLQQLLLGTECYCHGKQHLSQGMNNPVGQSAFHEEYQLS